MDPREAINPKHAPHAERICGFNSLAIEIQLNADYYWLINTEISRPTEVN